MADTSIVIAVESDRKADRCTGGWKDTTRALSRKRVEESIMKGGRSYDDVVSKGFGGTLTGQSS